jgi:hypothetical protein
MKSGRLSLLFKIEIRFSARHYFPVKPDAHEERIILIEELQLSVHQRHCRRRCILLHGIVVFAPVKREKLFE